MAFGGYLVKLGGTNGTVIPLTYLKYNTYKLTPDQMLDLDSTRDTTGVLHRTVLDHTATVVQVNVVSMEGADFDTLNTLIRANFTNAKERSIYLEYFDPFTSSYKVGLFYMPDIQYTIRNVDADNLKINYSEFTLKFIEY